MKRTLNLYHMPGNSYYFRDKTLIETSIKAENDMKVGIAN